MGAERMTEAVISLRDARLSLTGAAGPVEILRGITLQVARGETLGLVGPSGSGKSSLLMLMGGLERATGGEVMAQGRDLTALNEDQLARFRRDNMGVVFQSFHLIPTMTALENVALPLELNGARDAFERAEDELAAVGLATRKGHYPAQLSGANNSAWRWRGPPWRARRSCWRMSRPAIWTARTVRRSWTCCSVCATGMARRWFL